jgi:hypothetical protein
MEEGRFSAGQFFTLMSNRGITEEYAFSGQNW